MNEETIYVSIHITKTGGTTLGIILEKKFGNRLQKVYAKEKGDQPTDALCYHGHKIFKDFPEVMKIENSKWFTFLRDPLESAISMYHYFQKRTEAGFVDKGLEHFLTHQIEYVWPSPPGYPHNRYYKKIGNFYKLNHEFEFVGITERFDESIFLMFHLFNWDLIPYTVRNRGDYSKPQVNSAIAEKFRELNSLDVGLYEEAHRRLDKLISDYGPNFQTDLENFKLKCEEFTEEQRRLWLEAEENANEH